YLSCISLICSFLLSTLLSNTTFVNDNLFFESGSFKLVKKFSDSKMSLYSCKYKLPVYVIVRLCSSLKLSITVGVYVLYTKYILAILTRNRSEEHTSELQSRFDLVCRLLIENKKTTSK